MDYDVFVYVWNSIYVFCMLYAFIENSLRILLVL